MHGESRYQGENDMGGSPGSSLDSVGYGCMQPRMVAAWRELWSATEGTTDPLAPFGVVTFAPGLEFVRTDTLSTYVIDTIQLLTFTTC